MDIEDLVKELPSKHTLCPYFATKANIEYADVNS